jgi:hypothetical protein
LQFAPIDLDGYKAIAKLLPPGPLDAQIAFPHPNIWMIEEERGSHRREPFRRFGVNRMEGLQGQFRSNKYSINSSIYQQCGFPPDNRLK